MAFFTDPGTSVKHLRVPGSGGFFKTMQWIRLDAGKGAKKNAPVDRGVESGREQPDYLLTDDLFLGRHGDDDATVQRPAFRVILAIWQGVRSDRIEFATALGGHQ